MSFLSLFGKEKEEVSLLIDIGNGSITASLVVFSLVNIPKFIYTSKTEFPVLEKINTSKILEDMQNLLDEVLKTIIERGFILGFWKGKDVKLSHIMISFSSPWFVSKTKHISISEKSPFAITEKFLDDISSKEEEIFKKELIESGDMEGDTFEVIEKSIVHTKINGYILKESVGKSATSLDAYLFMSIIGDNVVDKISSIILKYTHIPKEKILIHTFPLVSFSVVRDVFNANSDFLLIDITREVTDLTLVKDNVIFSTTNIPSGRNIIIREIAEMFDVPKEIGLSMLHMYTAGEMDSALVPKIEEVLINVEKEWAVYLENALFELSPDMSLPSRVYVTAESDIASLYIDFLKLSKTDATSAFRKNMDLIYINQDTLKPFFTNESSTQPDEFISILAIFYNKIMRSQNY